VLGLLAKERNARGKQFVFHGFSTSPPRQLQVRAAGWERAAGEAPRAPGRLGPAGTRAAAAGTCRGWGLVPRRDGTPHPGWGRGGSRRAGADGEAASDPSGMCFKSSCECVAAGSCGDAAAGAGCSRAGSCPHPSGPAVAGDVSNPPVAPLDTGNAPIAFFPLYTVAQGEGEQPASLAQPWHRSSVSELPAPGMLGGTGSGRPSGEMRGPFRTPAPWQTGWQCRSGRWRVTRMAARTGPGGCRSAPLCWGSPRGAGMAGSCPSSSPLRPPRAPWLCRCSHSVIPPPRPGPAGIGRSGDPAEKAGAAKCCLIPNLGPNQAGC